MSNPPENSNQSSVNESDNQIIEKIQPKVSLLLGLLLGIFGNFFVSAIFVGMDVSSINLNAKRTIVALGVVSGVFCILLLIHDLYPDLNRIKNYPKQSESSKYLLWGFIITIILIGICGVFGLFAPNTSGIQQNSSESCHNVTYVVNSYTYYQNFTFEQIKIEKSDTPFSVNELKYLINGGNGTSSQ